MVNYCKCIRNINKDRFSVRFLKRLLITLVVFGLLGGALPIQPAVSAIAATEPTLRILSTTFPIWLITRNVAAHVPGVSVELMIPAQAGCPHDYGLTPQDMAKLAQADILVMNGLGLEAFLGASPAMIQGRLQPGARVLVASEGLDDLLPYGEGADADGARNAHGGPTFAASGGLPPNPHVFVAPRMAGKLAVRIGDGLSGLDPAHAELYQANASAYAAALNRLADDFAALGARVDNPRIVTQHRDFDYLAREAGLEVVAVVQTHEGQEPSAAAMLRLVREIRDNKVGAIFTEPQYPAKTSETLARETGVPVAVLDPAASGPADAPLDYYQRVMAANLRILESTLGTH